MVFRSNQSRMKQKQNPRSSAYVENTSKIG
jgi:hypothetical protein